MGQTQAVRDIYSSFSWYICGLAKHMVQIFSEQWLGVSRTWFSRIAESPIFEFLFKYLRMFFNSIFFKEMGNLLCELLCHLIFEMNLFLTNLCQVKLFPRLYIILNRFYNNFGITMLHVSLKIVLEMFLNLVINFFYGRDHTWKF